MKLVVGLGNPGGDYRNTYHNIGFCALDRLAARLCLPEFCFDKKCEAEVSDARIAGQRVLFAKPQTYMNLSGNAVSALSRYYKIEPSDILVVYDDIEIKKGVVRARPSGSAGTHNGMRDIVNKLGSTEFARVRIGIGLKPNYMALADYVLSRFSDLDRPILDGACALACDFVCDWIENKEWRDLTVTVS